MLEDRIKKENAVTAISDYTKILSDLKLKEGIKYSSKFLLKLFPSGDGNIDIIKPSIYIDFYALSPLLSLECYSGTNLSGTIYFAKKDLILDYYDQLSILDNMENLEDQNIYNIELLKDFLKTIKLKKLKEQEEIEEVTV